MRVAPLVKQGDTDINDALSNTQYGFRPQRSTSHAICIMIIPRLQDYAESKGARLSLALLDWETAFDKVQHDELIVA